MSQKVVIKNPDGTEKQLSTDSNGNLNVAVTGPKILYDNSSTPYTTTASFADVTGGGGSVVGLGGVVLIQIQENNTNAVLIQILASNNGSDWVTLNQADIPVAKNGQDYEVITVPWKYIKVQAKDAVGGTHGSVKVIISK